MWGVARVAINFGGGKTSVVGVGRRPAVGNSVADTEEMIETEVSVAGLEGKASVEGLLGEQALRITVQKRSVRTIRDIVD